MNPFGLVVIGTVDLYVRQIAVNGGVNHGFAHADHQPVRKEPAPQPEGNGQHNHQAATFIAPNIFPRQGDEHVDLLI